LPNIEDIPDIEFTVGITLETVKADLINDYEAAYLAQQGTRKTLAQGDPIRILLSTQSLREFQIHQAIESASRDNQLKYSAGDYLDNVVAGSGVTRLAAKSAITTLQFTLSAIQVFIVSIPQGTRVTAGDDVFFETVEYTEIGIGDTQVSVSGQCQTTGSVGNEYVIGQLNILVDPIAYVASVTNTTATQDGSDIESDDSLRARAFLAPESYSVAGPAGAYEFLVKSYSQSIIDVYVGSPAAGAVDIRFLLTDGEIPGSTIMDEVEAYMSESERRPLTDYVYTFAPGTTSYDIDATYYIDTPDASRATEIQAAVTTAVADYIIWQRSKIGRDVNDSELSARIKAAGAKRCVITDPAHAVIADTSIAVIGTESVTYGGLE